MWDNQFYHQCPTYAYGSVITPQHLGKFTVGSTLSFMLSVVVRYCDATANDYGIVLTH